LPSFAELTVSAEHELARGELFEAHRPEGVQLRGRDADLGAAAAALPAAKAVEQFTPTVEEFTRRCQACAFA
jgi:hypothetical protein